MKDAATSAAQTVVMIETSMGTIEAELWADRAPGTVSNFLDYVNAGFFDGLVFHRVIPGFMIQGGGFTPDMQQKPTRAPIRNEACSDAKNAKGTLAMARTSQIHSATAQFFVNLVDNDFLDHRNEAPDGFGYCVFGKVTEGMEVVEAIGKVKTGAARGMRDVPVDPVVIRQIRVKVPD